MAFPASSTCIWGHEVPPLTPSLTCLARPVGCTGMGPAWLGPLWSGPPKCPALLWLFSGGGSAVKALCVHAQHPGAPPAPPSLF